MARQGATVGVDIGSAAIKVVELTGNGMPTVRAAASAATPAGTIEEGRITDPQAVGRVLRELMRSAGIRSRQAVAAVNGQVALMREVRMPAAPAEEIRQAARFEVERYLPYPIADVTYDAVVIGEGRDDGNKRLDVLIVAARTDVVSQHAAALSAAGLEPVVLEVEPLAVARALSSRAAPEQVKASIHLGSGVTMILVAEGEVPRVIRTVAFGTSQLLQSAASKLGVTGEAAAELQARFAAAGGDGVPGFAEAIGDGLSSLVTEIRRSLEYYSGRYKAVAPDRVAVTGGGASLPGVTLYLTSALDMPVEVGDPFADLGGPPPGGVSGPMAAYAVAVGLALRGAGER